MLGFPILFIAVAATDEEVYGLSSLTAQMDERIY